MVDSGRMSVEMRSGGELDDRFWRQRVVFGIRAGKILGIMTSVYILSHIRFFEQREVMVEP